jgi:hypothetical protein
MELVPVFKLRFGTWKRCRMYELKRGDKVKIGDIMGTVRSNPIKDQQGVWGIII